MNFTRTGRTPRARSRYFFDDGIRGRTRGGRAVFVKLAAQKYVERIAAHPAFYLHCTAFAATRPGFLRPYRIARGGARIFKDEGERRVLLSKNFPREKMQKRHKTAKKQLTFFTDIIQ